MFLIEYQNPFDLDQGRVLHEIEPGTHIGQWVRERYHGHLEWVAFVVVNGIEAKDLGAELIAAADDDIRLMLKPGEPMTIISTVLTVISIAATILNPPQEVVPLPEQSPTYSIDAQRNQARLGSGIPIHYGTMRVWPDFVTQPYTVYQNNEQYLYQVFCIGLGEFDFEDLFIDDTNVSAFDEVTFAYYYNQPVKLFPTNVETSVEPANQELGVAFTGPFVANATATTTNRLEIDIVFTGGLYRARSSGNIDDAEVTIIAEYIEIDNAGVEIGVWTEFVNEAIKDGIREPLRITRGEAVTEGRYKVRVRRDDVQSTGPKIFNRVVWEGMRAFLVDDAISYEDITVLAVRVKATGNLNTTSSRRFNVIATGKKPTRVASAWTAATATNSIAWALADIVRNQYIGNQADSKLDIAALEALDVIYTSRDDEFNYRFIEDITLWDSIKLIAKAGRTYPVLNADFISFTRTSAEAIPATIYNRNNTVKGKFRVEYKFRGEDSFDSVLAEFIDPNNNYQKSVVLCQPPTSAAAKPRTVHYHGITDRDQAFREGIYDAEVELVQRKTAKLITELEGFIPARGNLVSIVNENFDFDQGGDIVDVTGVTITVSELLTWTPSVSHSILIRKDNGEVSGPHLVTEGAAYKAILSAPLSFSPSTGPTQERAKYQFGVVGSTASQWVVADIKSLGNRRVELAAVNYVASVHTVDTATAPAANIPVPLLNTPSAPIITTLLVENTSNPGILRLGWNPAPGADSYVIEKSFDSGVTWLTVGETENTFFEFFAPPGTIDVRVAGVGATRGPFKTFVGAVNQFVLNSPSGLTLTSELVLNTENNYQSSIVFSFTPPVDDYHIVSYEAQVKLARHLDWVPLFNALETTYTYDTPELGTHEFRVRSIYIPDEVQSNYAETSIEITGTKGAIATIGLTDPVNPLLFVTADKTKEIADIKVQVGFDESGSARAEWLAVFYAVEKEPNALGILNDTGAKLYLDPNNVGIVGEFSLVVGTGSTDQVVIYEPDSSIDIDLSGMWWMSIDDGVTPTRYHKIVESSTTELKIPLTENLAFVPSPGDTINIVELDWHDSRLQEFKLLSVRDEIIQHNGIQYDGNYYVDPIVRGAEGTIQADQSGQTAYYFPALGADTFVILIDMADFNVVDGVLEYTGTIDVRMPGEIFWAAVSCCFFTKGSTEDKAAYVRSNILSLTVAGGA